MKTFLKSLAAVACLLVATSVLAQDYIVLDQRADEFDRWQDRVDSSYGPVTIISRETNVPIQVLEEQRARTRLGYGGLLIGNAIAVESGRSFDEIAALRASGRGWGDIGREYNVNVGQVVSRLQRADSAYRGEGNFKRDEMKAAKFVNGHDARDGKLDGTGPKRSRGGFEKVKGNGNGHVKIKGGGHGNGGGHAKGGGHGHGGGKGKK
ncbi:MAG: hypothetical protein ABR526_05065 [Chthoniobacterales bacterium]